MELSRRPRLDALRALVGAVRSRAAGPRLLPEAGRRRVRRRARQVRGLPRQVAGAGRRDGQPHQRLGHEISHGFDGEGSQYDGDGNLRDWWTPQDRERFKARTQALVAQYAAFVPVPGHTVNGELTLGENIADNAGLGDAYKAYRLSLAAKPAPVLDGMSGDERFFHGFAQAWRSKARAEALLAQVKSDPHSPDEFRVNGSVRNQLAFYSTFGVKPGDKMHLPPAERVSIW